MKSVAERLEARSVPEPNTGCLLWTGARTARGYGVIGTEGRKNMLTHRAAYEIAYGPVPDGMFVCHHCDTPACINPSHLFAGSHTDNMRDMARKGRGWLQRNPEKASRGDASWARKHPELLRRGAEHHASKLTEATVALCRDLHAKGVAIRALARRFGVSQQAMQNAIRGKTWQWVGPAVEIAVEARP